MHKNDNLLSSLTQRHLTFREQAVLSDNLKALLQDMAPRKNFEETIGDKVGRIGQRIFVAVIVIYLFAGIVVALFM